MADNMSNGAIGKRIYQARLMSGKSQGKVALECGYRTKSSIHAIEKGKASVPIAMLLKIASAVGETPEYLATGIRTTDEPKKHKAPNLMTTYSQLTTAHKKELQKFAKYLLYEQVNKGEC